ncbi:MAG: DEAD/DEAH box helicase [Limnochordales bacterium]|nr:DEAD/DEAH box helicase [Limnochordales bacterium]
MQSQHVQPPHDVAVDVSAELQGKQGSLKSDSMQVELPPRPPTTYRGYLLDPFQAEAIALLEQGKSVLVAAPTGTGKTLIADYIVEKVFREGREVVYTAPIKALSNQKFKEFKRLLGEDAVGIITGDVVFQPDAPVRVMTTEIFRNMLHLDPDRLSRVSYVIFDEIHWLADPERGSVWEESLIFLPPTINFLGLSATVPNVEELARWVESVHQRPVAVVRHDRRAVPLEHRFFEASRGFCTYEQLKRAVERRRRVLDYDGDSRHMHLFPPTTHLDLVMTMGREYLPCLFFSFSRRKCEANAEELAEVVDYLSQPEKRQVAAVIEEALRRYGTSERKTPNLSKLKQLLLRGIGYHHAGLLPVVKEIVETLFEKRLIYVLYCTETFAVGLNFPCRTVCFDGLTKWDGRAFRPLTHAEYFQMAGRAGRRGIDEKGFVFTLVDLNYFDPREIPEYDESKIEPLVSQFSLSYNTVLNLVRKYSTEEIHAILRKNFAAYQCQVEREAIEAKLRQAYEQAGIGSAACSASGTVRCPLVYERRQKELEELRRRLASPRRRGRAKGQKGLQEAEWRRVRELEAELATVTPVECSKKARKACRREEKRRQELEKRNQQLLRRLAELEAGDRFIDDFEDRRLLLSAMDYIRGDTLTARGEFAAQIHTQELLVTELYFAGIFHKLDIHQLAALAVSIDYEPRRGDPRVPNRCLDLSLITPHVRWVERMEREFLGQTCVRFQDDLAQLAYEWSRGKSFSDLLKGIAIDPGDVVFAFRRAIDLLRQVRIACEGADPIGAGRVAEAISRLDRDEVAVVL